MRYGYCVGMTTTISDALRRLRLERGLTQPQLAARAGVSRSLIARLEAGASRRAQIGSLQALARALDVPIGRLLGEGTP